MGRIGRRAIGSRNFCRAAAWRGGGIGWEKGTAATLPGSMVSWRSTGGIVALLLDHRLMAIIPPGCTDGRSRRLRKLKSMAVPIRPPVNEFRDNGPPTRPQRKRCRALLAPQSKTRR